MLVVSLLPVDADTDTPASRRLRFATDGFPSEELSESSEESSDAFVLADAGGGDAGLFRTAAFARAPLDLNTIGAIGGSMEDE